MAPTILVKMDIAYQQKPNGKPNVKVGPAMMLPELLPLHLSCLWLSLEIITVTRSIMWVPTVAIGQVP